MRELRLINYNNCSLEEAIISTKKGEIASFTEDSTKVIISDSKLLIVKTPCSDSTLKSQAPDHLLRLFAYNDVLRKLGPKYFEKEKYEDELFREAEEAYVVTPLTGMIVLESDEDYDRMGIKRNTNTVGNAGVLTGGAVPEPHEWLLIALVAFFIMRSISKKRQLTFNR
jgi:XrtN system VIT domain protein